MALILVVEDDPMLRTVLVAALMREGHDVVHAPDGRTAISILTSRPFDLVVLDIIMPEMDGLEMLNVMHDAKLSIPVVAMSGGGHLDADLVLRTAKFLGAGRILAKPFQMADLLRAVEEALAK